MRIVLPQGMDGANVGMVQCRSSPRLVHESTQSFRVARELGGQELQSNEAPKAQLPSLVNNPHPAAPQLFGDLVTGDGRKRVLTTRIGSSRRARRACIYARQPIL